MEEYIGRLDSFIIFPDNIKHDKDKCDELLNKLVDNFIKEVEKENCCIFSIIEIENADEIASEIKDDK